LAHKHFAITYLTPGAEDDDDLEIIIPGRFPAQFSINSQIMISLSSMHHHSYFSIPPPLAATRKKKHQLYTHHRPLLLLFVHREINPSTQQSINQSTNGAKQSINNLQIYISNKQTNKQTNNMTNVLEPSTSNVLEVKNPPLP
jgi:hypothetical protein